MEQWAGPQKIDLERSRRFEICKQGMHGLGSGGYVEKVPEGVEHRDPRVLSEVLSYESNLTVTGPG